MKQKSLILRFILRSIAFLLTMFVVLIVPAIIWYLKLPVNPDNGLLALKDKHQRISKANHPQLLFIGGSGCGMSIDSRIIDTALGRYSVTNMGVFGQLGLCFMIHEVEDDLKSGDVAVIIPEFQQFYYQYYGDIGLLRSLKLYPSSVRYLSSWQQWSFIATQFAPHFISQLNHNMENPPSIPPMWRRSNVNAYGDFCGHLSLQDTIDVSDFKLFRKEPSKLKIDMSAINDMNSYYNSERSKGVRVVMMYPCIPSGVFLKNREILEQLDSTLRHDLRIPIVNTINSDTLDASMFFDTVYHLNGKGRLKRSFLLLSHLEAFLRDEKEY